MSFNSNIKKTTESQFSINSVDIRDNSGSIEYRDNGGDWNKIGNGDLQENIVDASDYNSGSLNSTTINAAITAIGSTNKTLYIKSGAWTISANVTFPSNINVRFARGAVLSIDSSRTVTINGSIDAGLWQIFSGAGDAILVNSKNLYTFPEWFGAVADNSTDCSTAIQNAIYSISPVKSTTPNEAFSTSNVYRYGGTVLFSRGIYKTLFTVYNNCYVHLKGVGGSVAFNKVSLSATSPQGTVINFQPDVVTNKIAIDFVGFVKSTGARYTSTTPFSGADIDAGTYSEIYSSSIEDITVHCKDEVFLAVRMMGAATSYLKNVSIAGSARNGLFIGASWGGSCDNVQSYSKGQGLIVWNDTNGWAFPSKCYFTGTGTLTGNIDFPVSDYPDASKTCGATVRYTTSINFDNLIVEHWNYGFSGDESTGLTLNSTYVEDIQDIGFFFRDSKFSIDNVHAYSPAASMFKLIYQVDGSNISNVSGSDGGASYNKLFDTATSSADKSIYVRNCALSPNDNLYNSIYVMEDFTVKPDVIDIYVDASAGNDDNWGYSSSYPVYTVAGAINRFIHGKVNRINLKAAQTHTLTSNLTEIANHHTVVIQKYSTGGNPELKSLYSGGNGKRIILTEGVNLKIKDVNITTVSISDQDTKGIFAISGNVDVEIEDSTIQIETNSSLFQPEYTACGNLNVSFIDCSITGYNATYGYLGTFCASSDGFCSVIDNIDSSTTVNSNIQANGYHSDGWKRIYTKSISNNINSDTFNNQQPSYYTTSTDSKNFAKGQLIGNIYNLLASKSNIMGLWIFDQQGASTTIIDRSPKSHNITLSANASTMNPGYAGFCPYLNLNESGEYETISDNDDYSFGNGVTDNAFSIVTLLNPNSMSGYHSLLSKWDETTGNEKREFEFHLATGKLGMQIYDESANAIMGRYYNTAFSDAGSWVTYAGTYNGSSLVSGIKVYRNGTRVDNTSDTSGVYVAMENLGSVVGNYYTSTGGVRSGITSALLGVQMIVKEELSVEQLKELDYLLRSYAGSDLIS